ncbi:nucleoid-associated protein [Jeotgalibaca caeni]|uniref:nucleoid-associated protein n=1 Tax=Jeotgalibaca caeni TaxID=3028623 RepID=UPI00237DADBF|nr:nucleoid-associated protein [Jeotgalibaca caeni]MDE1549624.1 nucleoid-associated protein [Jeotgalibaca caeni]
MIYIQEAILHIFDLNTNEPIYSFAGLNLEEKFTLDYIHAMIAKVEDSDNMKEGQLAVDNPIIPLFQRTQTDFVAATKGLTDKFFDITKINPEIPPADLLFVLFTMDEVPCLGIFKLNYSDSVTHHVSYETETLTNQLIMNRSILPSARQAIQEGLVLNLEQMEYHVIEKKHMITELAEKVFYFTELFLGDQPKPSLKENISIIKKAVQKTSKAFNDEEFQVLASTKEALVHSMEEEKVIDHRVIADSLFGDNFAKKEKFYAEVEDMGYVDRAPAEVAVAGPKYSKQKLRLNNGIEISIPLELYKDPEVVEFINNPDGTTSVMIKNIEKIKNLF